MYEANFGLDARPFSSVAQTDQYYPATAIESSRQTLDRAVQRAEGVGLVVGPAGTGKTYVAVANAVAALKRKESRGPHFRTDFPQRNDKHFGKPIVVHKKDGALEYRFRNLE